MKTFINDYEIDFLFDLLIKFTKGAQQQAIEIMRSVPVNTPLSSKQEDDIQHYKYTADMCISILEKLAIAYEQAEIDEAMNSAKNFNLH